MTQQRILLLALSSSLILLGGVVVVGWYLECLAITNIHQRYSPMQYNTALCFIFLGLALILQTLKNKTLSLLPTILVFVFSLLSFSEFLLNANFGLDTLFFVTPIVPLDPRPGRMPLITAVSFCIGSLAILGLVLSKKLGRLAFFSDYLSVSIFVFGFISLLGYFVGLNLTEYWHDNMRMAAHTALGFIILGLTLFIATGTQSINKFLECLTFITLVLITEISADPSFRLLLFILGSVVLFTHWRLKKQNEILELEKSKSIQSAKLASLGELSAGVAHEIRNPLAIITSSLGLLRKHSQDPEKLKELIMGIDKSCDRINKIIGGLKTFSRTSERSIYHTYSLNEIIKEALVLVGSNAKDAEIALTYETQGEFLISCNVIEIEQVIINLINNAIHAVKELPNKWIKIETSSQSDNVILKISDSGSGIPERIRSKLFEPFFTTKPVGQGTGLGLSISKGILDEHGATIQIIDNTANTCFEIRFKKEISS